MLFGKPRNVVRLRTVWVTSFIRKGHSTSTQTRLWDSVIMLRYTIGTPFQSAFPQPGSESAHKNPLLSRLCAVNGVTFHRIFRLVDPFVKVHILIIKLDRFSRPFFLSLGFCCCFTSTCKGESMTIFSLSLLWSEKIWFYALSEFPNAIRCISAWRVNFLSNTRLEAGKSAVEIRMILLYNFIEIGRIHGMTKSFD